MATWQNNFSIGIPEIDQQHKQLCEKIDNLRDACSQGKGSDEALKVLEFLESYTIKHFSDEEKFQLKINYPNYQQHKQLHIDFISQISKLKTDMLASGVTLPMVIQINQVITDWLINHIMRVDKDLKNYV
jgi:hemerythrin